MDLLAMGDYVICKPYSFSKNQNGLIVGNDTDCFAQIVNVNIPYSSFVQGDIVWYDRTKAITCSLNGETYIAIKKDGIISRIKEQ